MKKLLLLILLIQSSILYASTYDCKVTRKISSSEVVSESELEKLKFSVRIHDNSKPELERCSFVKSHNKVTCDKYSVDKVEIDNYVGIKKFYYFTGQFDVQLYPDFRFIENNGRGVISYGKCEKL